MKSIFIKLSIISLICCLTNCKSIKKTESASRLEAISASGNLGTFGFAKYNIERMETLYAFIQCPNKEEYAAWSADSPNSACFTIYDALTQQNMTDIRAAINKDFQDLHNAPLLKKFGGFLNNPFGSKDEENIPSPDQQLKKDILSYSILQIDTSKDVEVNIYLFNKIKEFLTDKISSVLYPQPFNPYWDLGTTVADLAIKGILSFQCKKVKKEGDNCIGAITKMIQILDQHSFHSQGGQPYVIFFSTKWKEMAMESSTLDLLAEVNNKAQLGPIGFSQLITDIQTKELATTPEQALEKLAVLFSDTNAQFHMKWLADQLITTKQEQEMSLLLRTNFATFSYYLSSQFGAILRHDASIRDVEPKTERPYHLLTPMYLSQKLINDGVEVELAIKVVTLFSLYFELFEKFADIAVEQFVENELDLLEIVKGTPIGLYKKITTLTGLLTYLPSGEETAELHLLKLKLNSEDLEDIYYGYAGAHYGAALSKAKINLASMLNYEEFMNCFLNLAPHFKRGPFDFLKRYELNSYKNNCRSLPH